MSRWLFKFIFILPIASFAEQPLLNADPTNSPERLVEEFQRIPHEQLFCSIKNWERGENGAPKKLLPEFERYFSASFLKLFAWSQCGIPHELENAPIRFNFDYRFGLSQTNANYGNPLEVKDVRLLSNMENGDNKIRRIVVTYSWEHKSGFITKYSVIQEMGKWKIDDIALKGFATDEEEILPHISSLKRELQTAYSQAKVRRNAGTTTGK